MYHASEQLNRPVNKIMCTQIKLYCPQFNSETETSHLKFEGRSYKYVGRYLITLHYNSLSFSFSSLSFSLPLSLFLSLTLSLSLSLSPTHTYTHAHTRLHTHTHTYTHIPTHPHTHTYTHKHTVSRTLANCSLVEMR